MLHQYHQGLGVLTTAPKRPNQKPEDLQQWQVQRLGGIMDTVLILSRVKEERRVPGHGQLQLVAQRELQLEQEDNDVGDGCPLVRKTMGREEVRTTN